MGIVGFGRIGQATAKIALGLGMRVLPYDPVVKQAELDIDFCKQETLLPFNTTP